MEAQRYMTQEEEELHRQRLFRKARKGDQKATQELQNVYGVRVWSEEERGKLVYSTPQPKAKRGKQKTRKS